MELLRSRSFNLFDAVTSPDYREVTREPFTEEASASILLIEGSSGGGLPGACDLWVGRRFYFCAPSSSFQPVHGGTTFLDPLRSLV